MDESLRRELQDSSTDILDVYLGDQGYEDTGRVDYQGDDTEIFVRYVTKNEYDAYIEQIEQRERKWSIGETDRLYIIYELENGVEVPYKIDVRTSIADGGF